MSGQYYIRVRGEVKGPLTAEQINAQIRRKRLGKHHELSTDGVNWQKAGDMPEFFEPVITARTVVPLEVEQEVSTTTPAATAANAGTARQSGGTAEWYYAKGGNKLGPVTASELQMWLASGQLSSTDLVWHESFDNWVAAGDLPQFAAAASGARKSSGKVVQKPAGLLEIFFGLSRAAILPGDAIHKFPNLCRYLRIGETALRTSFVLSLLLLAAWVLHVTILMFDNLGALALLTLLGGVVGVCLLWLIFISGMAVLEMARVLIKIEDNTAQALEAGR